MNIIVFIKQVPDTTDVKWTENNNIDRAKMDSIMNPTDRQAVEAAIRLKEKYNAHTTALTMGPKKANEILREALAMGIDDAALLCDVKFSGSDTCATSKVLSAVIKEKYPNTDLILFGQNAIDGETSQTGPSTAARLGMPILLNVSDITDLNEKEITVETQTETNNSTYKMNLPAAICVNNYVETPRIPKIDGYIYAKDYSYNTYDITALGLNEEETGIKGSPTCVSKVYRNNDKRDCKYIYTEGNDNYIWEVINEMKEIMEQ